MKVLDVYNYIDSFAPFSSQEEWDNSGLLVGDKNAEVTKAVVCLDVNASVLDFASSVCANLIISHHPVIFSPLSAVTENSLVFKAVRQGISIISAHTNLDKAPGGVNDAFTEMLRFNYEKIYDASGTLTFLNVCYPENSFSAERLSLYLKSKLSCTLSYCDSGKAIDKIAICTGAGSDFIDDAVMLGCNAFITGEAKYHEFIEAKEKGISLFTVGHFESEIPAVKYLTDTLNNQFNSTVFVDAPETNTVITEK